MIVVPRVLTEQLRSAEEDLQRRLAVAFARHVVDTCAADLDSPEDVHRYLDAIVAFESGEIRAEELAEERSRLYRLYEDCRPGSIFSDVVDLVLLGGRVVAQRAFEEIGAVVRYSTWTPGALDVAKEAQRVVGRWVGEQHGEDPKRVRAAQWEEARWQLMRTIELAPNPNA